MVCGIDLYLFWLFRGEKSFEINLIFSLNVFDSVVISEGFWWVERIVYDKLISEKCVEDASEYIWLRLEARSLLIGKSQCVKLNLFRDKSDSFLKCLWLMWRCFRIYLIEFRGWGFWWVERKCMFDGVRNLCWRWFIFILIAFRGEKSFDW